MRSEPGFRHGRLHSPEADGLLDVLQLADELRGVGFDLEGEHSAEAACHLFFGDGVAGMFFQAGVVHVGDLWFAGHEFGDRLGAPVLLLHADDDGLQASFDQPAYPCVEAAAEDQCALPYLLCQFLVGDGHSRAEVAMAADVFGGAVCNDVDTHVDGILVYGRCEGVVDDRYDSVFAGDGGDAGDVGDFEERVRGSLYIYDFGVLADSFFEGFEVGDVDHAVFDAILADMIEGGDVSSPVQVGLEEYMVAGFDDGEYRCEDGGHPGGEYESGLGILEGCDLFGDGIVIGGVEVARVKDDGVVIDCG